MHADVGVVSSARFDIGGILFTLLGFYSQDQLKNLGVCLRI